MGISISQDKQFISIDFYKIDYEGIFSLLTLLKVEKISIFVNEIKGYRFNNSIFINDFIEDDIKLKESLLIFDGYVKECVIDKEIELLSNRRILIEINWGENYVAILINKKKANISLKDIEQRINIGSWLMILKVGF